MRGFRRSLIGLIILAILGGYYYFYEIRYSGKKAKERQISEKIYPLEKSEIKKIVYKRGEEKVALKRTGGIWKVISPVTAKADKKIVDSLINNLTGLKSFRKLSDIKWDNPEFGLAENPVKISFYDKKDRCYTATFGYKNPTNSYFYTLKGKSKTVLLVWVYPDKLLKKTLYDFRFKKILSIQSNQVKEVKFEKGPSRVVLQKTNKHNWNIISPIKARGDRYAIEGFISSAADEKIVRFLDNPPQQPAVFGWKHPRMKITLKWKSSSLKKKGKSKRGVPSVEVKTTTILIGKDRDDSHVYVKVAGSPTVMIVKKGYLKELDKGLFDFRNKNVWVYEIDDVKRVRYENRDDHLTIEARKFPKEDVWRLTKPSKMLADTRAVENWLWDLSGFRIKKFLSKNEFSEMAGAPKPYNCLFEVEVRGKNSPLKLKLFHLDNKWAAQSDEPDWYYILDAKDVNKTFKSVFELRYRRIVKFEDTDVASVEIRKGAATYLFKKNKNLWYHRVGNKDVKIPNIDVLNFLWELSDLKYTKLLKEAAVSEAVEVKLFDKKGKSLAHIFFAPTKDGHAYIFTTKGKKIAYMIDKPGIKKFEEAYIKLTQPKE